jgi:hypothetical protein
MIPQALSGLSSFPTGPSNNLQGIGGPSVAPQHHRINSLAQREAISHCYVYFGAESAITRRRVYLRAGFCDKQLA